MLGGSRFTDTTRQIGGGRSCPRETQGWPRAIQGCLDFCKIVVFGKAEPGLTARMMRGELNLPKPGLGVCSDKLFSFLVKRRCVFFLSQAGFLELNQVCRG